MPIVNVHATKVIRGLRRPFIGNKMNINLTEEEIKICQIYGAKVEYVNETAPVEEKIVPPVEDEKKIEEADSNKEDEKIVPPVEDEKKIEEADSDKKEEASEVKEVEKQTEESDTNEEVPTEVKEEEKKSQSSKSSAKKKSN